MIFKGYVENGQLIPCVKSVMESFLKKIEGKRVHIDITLDRPKRTSQQNKYYWGVVCALPAEHTGYEPEEIHEIHKTMFLATGEVIEIGGESIKRTRSTTDLNTVEFNELIEKKIIPFWAEQDVYIPLPNEVQFY